MDGGARSLQSPTMLLGADFEELTHQPARPSSESEPHGLAVWRRLHNRPLGPDFGSFASKISNLAIAFGDRRVEKIILPRRSLPIAVTEDEMKASPKCIPENFSEIEASMVI